MNTAEDQLGKAILLILAILAAGAAGLALLPVFVASIFVSVPWWLWLAAPVFGVGAVVAIIAKRGI